MSPAKSKAQQRAFAVAKAIQAGKAKPDPSKGPAADIAKNAKKKDVDDIASTKTKNLPDKVKKEESIFRNTVREVIQELLDEMKLNEFGTFSSRQHADSAKAAVTRYAMIVRKAEAEATKGLFSDIKGNKYDPLDFMTAISSGDMRKAHPAEREFLEAMWLKNKDNLRKLGKMGKRQTKKLPAAKKFGTY